MTDIDSYPNLLTHKIALILVSNLYDLSDELVAYDLDRIRTTIPTKVLELLESYLKLVCPNDNFLDSKRFLSKIWYSIAFETNRLWKPQENGWSSLTRISENSYKDRKTRWYKLLETSETKIIYECKSELP